KVDFQNIIETLKAGLGGRDSLTRSYVQALEASIAKNFKGNGCIACMCHNTDGLYCAKQTAIIRAPDSLHPAAGYHVAARSIGGCPIYVNDKPGNHNFDLLKKLVLPDGSVLRAQLPGRPTPGCHFIDPVRYGTSLLKVWNVNKCTCVEGVCNCQGAAQVNGHDWHGETIVFCQRSGEVVWLRKCVLLLVTLKVLKYEVFYICPLKEISENISVAPIGTSCNEIGEVVVGVLKGRARCHCIDF
ncbi:probable galactinol--sucrose galactosyltransferase 2, partial [Tanacetum coccineum]